VKADRREKCVWRQLEFPVVLPQPKMLPMDRQAKRGPLPSL
jgi:hypothetical protein